MKITFRIVTIGEQFSCNGNVYTKVSTRTAKLASTGRTIYLKQYAICSI